MEYGGTETAAKIQWTQRQNNEKGDGWVEGANPVEEAGLTPPGESGLQLVGD